MRPTLPSPSLPNTVPVLPLPLRLPTASRQYLRPAYAAAFSCIGGACEETCCQGWSVPVDQATWERYRSHEVMKSSLGTLIQINTSNPTTADYARLPLLVTGRCGFLDEESLCGIQKRFGPEMLSHTCRTYPRALSTHGTEVETALNLSCPEAARLVLLDPVLLDPALLPLAAGARYRRFQELMQADRLDLRDLALAILTDRRYPLWQRLILLGDLTRRLQTLAGAEAPGPWVDGHPAESARLLAEAARAASGQRRRAEMNRIPPDPASQLQIVVKLLQLRLTQPAVPARFLECVTEFEQGIGVLTHATEEALLAAYVEADHAFLKPLLEEYPQVLENYLINHIFKNDYPFGRQSKVAPLRPPNAQDEHLSLSIHVALAQTLLTGMAGRYREAFGVTHVVKLMQSLARTVEHSKNYLDQILTLVREQGFAPHATVQTLQSTRQ